MYLKLGLSLTMLVISAAMVLAFSVDTSEQPPRHPPQSPADGSIAVTNPPSMVWRHDETAVSYIVEMAQTADFTGDMLRVEGIDMPFYNHSEVLPEGLWHWRYCVVREGGAVSDPSPSLSFRHRREFGGTPDTPV